MAAGGDEVQGGHAGEGMLCRLHTQPLQPGPLLDGLSRRLGGGAGALASFVGQVRGQGGCTGLAVEGHEDLTQADLLRLAQVALRHWGLRAVEIHHRLGRMAPGEPIVLVAAAAAHRGDAQTACSWLMDALKSQVTLWKKELHGQGQDGREQGRWLEPSPDDLRLWQGWLRRHPQLAAAAWDPALRQS